MLVAADPAALKLWLVRNLEPLSDAEPAVLANYVLALLKHDVRDLDHLRQLCTHELDVFLERHTAHFVDSLLRVLRDPAAIVGTVPRGPTERLPSSALPAPAPAPAPSPAVSALKRPRSPPPPPSAAKHPRVHPASAPGAGQPYNPPVVPADLVPGFGAPRAPCRDYHFRGFCARGGACPFQHDTLPLPAPPPTPGPPFPQPFPLASPAPLSHGFPSGPPPARAPLGSYGRPPAANPRQPPKRPGRGSSRVISVDNIPPASLTDAAVRHFFQPFGAIIDLGIDAEERTATITFATPDQADRALASPQAVFGNRFVRVYRRPDNGAVPSGAPSSEVHARAPSVPPPASAPAPVTPVMPASPASSRAEALQRNAAQQRALLTEIEGAEASRKSVIMASLRQLATEADAIRSGATPVRVPNGTSSHAGSASEDALARLKALRQEAASLGITSESSPSTSGPSQRGAHGTEQVRHRPAKRRYQQQFRLDNRSRKVRVGPIDHEGKGIKARAYLETFGTIVAFDFAADEQACIVEFESRKTAEQVRPWQQVHLQTS
ncbi:hypothetical protein JCM3770_002486 [Rhodotorula araucariae]